MFLRNSFSAKISLPVFLKEIVSGKILEFSSIKATVLYLKSKNILADRHKISKGLKTGEPYTGYIFSKSHTL